jgi:hypothetical protein
MQYVRYIQKRFPEHELEVLQAAQPVKRLERDASEAFRGVFRDDVFAQLRVIFKADHRYYKQNGIYDFPHRNILRRVMTTAVYWVTSIPFIRNGMMRRFQEFMIMPYRRVLSA